MSMCETERSPRIQGLIDELYKNSPEIEAECALLITTSFKETENQPMVIRHARAFAKIMNEMQIVIRPNELIVGNLTKTPRGAQIFPEFSNKWLEEDFDRLAKRAGDVFNISEDTKQKLSQAFKYWDGKKQRTSWQLNICFLRLSMLWMQVSLLSKIITSTVLDILV